MGRILVDYLHDHSHALCPLRVLIHESTEISVPETTALVAEFAAASVELAAASAVDGVEAAAAAALGLR